MQSSVADVAKRILSLCPDRPARIAVDGFCAAGKTTFADRLADHLSQSGRPAIRVSADDFQNPPEKRYALGKDSPEGFYRHAIDFRSLRSELLEPLSGPHEFRYRRSTYDILLSKPASAPFETAARDSVVVVDGLFLFVPILRVFWDFSVYLHVPFEECIARARRRNQENLADADAVEERYRARYVPGYQRYLSEVDPESLADVIVESESG